MVAACGGGAATPASTPPSAIEATNTPASTASTTSTPPTTTATSSATSSEAERNEETGDDGGCRTVADLEAAEELGRWRIVNDGVMGGRSSAEAQVADSVLLLTGEIVTDGGGFSSVRLDLDEPLGDVTRLQLRVRTDGRRYDVTMADAAPGRDRRVSHQAPIDATAAGEWAEVTVDLTDLDTSIFGQSVVVDPFVPAAAVEVGVILADGADGPFRIELDWIRACP